MGRGRDGAGHIRRVPVRGTVPSAFWRAVLVLAAAIWVAPSCVHPAAGGHSTLSTRCPDRLADNRPGGTRVAGTGARPPLPAQDPLTATAPHRCPADVSRTGTGTGSDNCVAGPRAVVQALVPTPVPPPSLAEVPPPGTPRDPDSVRAPPDHLVRALGLHQLQVLRT